MIKDKAVSAEIQSKNRLILSLLSEYINFTPRAITADMINETKSLCNVSAEESFRILFAGIMDVYEDRELRNGWIRKIFTRLDNEIYENDPYKKTVKFNGIRDGEWELCQDFYEPYEAFVYNDLTDDGQGRIIPKIGFFEKKYTFPTVKQSGREWMLITPNEIETMRAPISSAFGNVTTYGLGLGYFAFMASEKENVKSVTVVEKDKNVIRLFEKHILPQFPKKEKIRIVWADAIEYAKEDHPCDFVFADIWHDPSDGCELYLKLKELERPDTQYAYWIENTIKYYL